MQKRYKWILTFFYTLDTWLTQICMTTDNIELYV